MGKCVTFMFVIGPKVSATTRGLAATLRQQAFSHWIGCTCDTNAVVAGFLDYTGALFSLRGCSVLLHTLCGTRSRLRHSSLQQNSNITNALSLS